MSSKNGADTVVRALADIDRAYKAAAAAIDAERNPQEAFRLATEVTESLRQRTTDSADLRVLAAARVFETEQMSLAGLADRIGVSKARAAQLMRLAKRDDPSSIDSVEEEASADG